MRLFVRAAFLFLLSKLEHLTTSGGGQPCHLEASDSRSLNHAFSRTRECLETRTGRGFQGMGAARLCAARFALATETGASFLSSEELVRSNVRNEQSSSCLCACDREM